MISFKDNLPKYIKVRNDIFVLKKTRLNKIKHIKNLYYVGYKKLLPFSKNKTSFYLITVMKPDLEECYSELFFHLNLKINYIDVSKDYE